jgi:hypothetical protein
LENDVCIVCCNDLKKQKKKKSKFSDEQREVKRGGRMPSYRHILLWPACCFYHRTSMAIYEPMLFAFIEEVIEKQLLPERILPRNSDVAAEYGISRSGR